MTEKDLKKLSRTDLLQMLIVQSEELHTVKEQLQQAEARLAERDIAIANAGSIAEASLALNGVFAAAQAACDQYTENIKKSDALCRRMEAETRLRCEKMLESAKRSADAYWNRFVRALSIYSVVHPELKELLEEALPHPLPFEQEGTYERETSTESCPGDQPAES